MSETVSLILSGPAKIGGRRYAPGAEVEVDTNVADQLSAGGLVDVLATMSPVPQLAEGAPKTAPSGDEPVRKTGRPKTKG